MGEESEFLRMSKGLVWPLWGMGKESCQVKHIHEKRTIVEALIWGTTESSWQWNLDIIHGFP